MALLVQCFAGCWYCKTGLVCYTLLLYLIQLKTLLLSCRIAIAYRNPKTGKDMTWNMVELSWPKENWHSTSDTFRLWVHSMSIFLQNGASPRWQIANLFVTGKMTSGTTVHMSVTSTAPGIEWNRAAIIRRLTGISTVYFTQLPNYLEYRDMLKHQISQSHQTFSNDSSNSNVV